MNRDEKAQLLNELKQLFEDSEVVVISHYKGLTVAEVSELRNNIRKAGAGFKVTKNRITRLALKDTKFADLADQFTGPTAIAFANDPISACKAVSNLQKVTKNWLSSAAQWERAFSPLTKSSVWQAFRRSTNCAPRSSVCCRLRPLSWPGLPKLTRKKTWQPKLSLVCGF